MSSSGELKKGGPPDWWLKEGTKSPHRKKKFSMLQNVTTGRGQIFLNDLSAKQIGHEIWHKEFDIRTEVRVADGSWKGISKV